MERECIHVLNVVLWKPLAQVASVSNNCIFLKIEVKTVAVLCCGGGIPVIILLIYYLFYIFFRHGFSLLVPLEQGFRNVLAIKCYL